MAAFPLQSTFVFCAQTKAFHVLASPACCCMNRQLPSHDTNIITPKNQPLQHRYFSFFVWHRHTTTVLKLTQLLNFCMPVLLCGLSHPAPANNPINTSLLFLCNPPKKHPVTLRTRWHHINSCPNNDCADASQRNQKYLSRPNARGAHMM